LEQEAQLPQRNSKPAAHVYIGWQCTEHRRIADVVQLDYCQIVSIASAEKVSDIRGRIQAYSSVFQSHLSLCH